jgi:serine O-acetyltransferase
MGREQSMGDSLRLYRVAHAALAFHVPLVAHACELVYRVVLGAVVPASAEIGRDTCLGYGGLGVVIHARAVIGENVVVGPHVIIGGRSGHHEVPVIEDDVFIGTGAKILGPVRVGAGSVIGAGAVVVRDVPPRSVVAGVPARVIRSDVDVRDFGSLPRDAGRRGPR